jgi:hypothetical protein
MFCLYQLKKVIHISCKSETSSFHTYHASAIKIHVNFLTIFLTTFLSSQFHGLIENDSKHHSSSTIMCTLKPKNHHIVDFHLAANQSATLWSKILLLLHTATGVASINFFFHQEC